MEKRSRSMDVLFPLGLLGLYVLVALVVILSAAGIYRDTAANSRSLSDSSGALTYLCQKLRQSDTPGALAVSSLEGCPAIVITQGDASLYDTYIYCYDGYLRELMVKRELTPAPSMGRCLVPMEDLQINRWDGLLELCCTDESGNSWQRYLYLASLEVSP